MDAIVYLIIIAVSSMLTIGSVCIYMLCNNSNKGTKASIDLSNIADNKNTSVDIGEIQKDFEEITKKGIDIYYLIESKD